MRNGGCAIYACHAYRTQWLIIQIKPDNSYVKEEPDDHYRPTPSRHGKSLVRFSLIPFILLVVPLAEISVFVLVGGQIGVLATLGLVLVTAVAGAILLRIQGFGVMERIRRTLEAKQVPGREMVHGVMIMIAGVLLLTPGFVTDTCGFLLFVPAIRDMAWRFVRDRIVVQTVHSRGPEQEPGRGPSRGGPTIDLDEEDFSSNRRDPRSPWIGKDD